MDMEAFSITRKDMMNLLHRLVNSDNRPSLRLLSFTVKDYDIIFEYYLGVKTVAYTLTYNYFNDYIEHIKEE